MYRAPERWVKFALFRQVPVSNSVQELDQWHLRDCRRATDSHNTVRRQMDGYHPGRHRIRRGSECLEETGRPVKPWAFGIAHGTPSTWQLAGIVKLTARRSDSSATRSGARLPSGRDRLSPGPKGAISKHPVVGGSQSMPAQVEEIPDSPMHRRETLRLSRGLELAHLPLSRTELESEASHLGAASAFGCRGGGHAPQRTAVLSLHKGQISSILSSMK